MNEKHFYMFILGILMQDVKVLAQAGFKYVFRKVFKVKSFEDKAPLLTKLAEELDTLKNKNE